MHISTLGAVPGVLIEPCFCVIWDGKGVFPGLLLALGGRLRFCCSTPSPLSGWRAGPTVFSGVAYTVLEGIRRKKNSISWFMLFLSEMPHHVSSVNKLLFPRSYGGGEPEATVTANRRRVPTDNMVVKKAPVGGGITPVTCQFPERLFGPAASNVTVSWWAAAGRKAEETPSTEQGCDAARRRGRPLATDRNDTSRGTP